MSRLSEVSVLEELEQASYQETPTSETQEPEDKKRKERSDKGAFKLTSRDSRVLTYIGEMFALRLDHLQELMGRHRQQRPKGAGKTGKLAETTVYSSLRRWKDARLVESGYKEGDKPPYVWLTAAGYRMVGLQYKDGAPSMARIRHIKSVIKVRLRLEELYPDGVWVSERELWQRVGRLPEKEKSHIDHVPDGELHLADGKIIVVEVELSKKPKDRLTAIMNGLKKRYNLEYNKQVEIWYFVCDETTNLVTDVAFEPNKDGKILFTKQQLQIKTLQGGYD